MGVSRTEFTFNTGILFWGFFYALITTAIGYIFYYEGLKHITKSSKVPVIASVEVIVASLIGVVWYREHLGFISFLGIVAVLLSTTIYLWLISLTTSKELSILLLKLYNDGAIGISASFLGLRVRKID